MRGLQTPHPLHQHHQMNNKIAIGCAAVAAVAGICVLVLAILVGTYNGYSKLEVKASAIQVDNTNVLDNTRKAVRDAAAIADSEVNALLKLVVGNAEARGKNSSGGGAISVTAVREAVPSIAEIKTLNKLMNIVVASRKDWQNSQTRLIETKRIADEALSTFPGAFLLPIMGKKPIEIIVVTSSETKSNFDSGEDNSSWIKPTPTTSEK